MRGLAYTTLSVWFIDPHITRYLAAASFPFDIAEGPPPDPIPSTDLALNALVQHGAHMLDCDRAFLSLIDNRSQFICAEMTRSQPLGEPDPNQPLLLGTARIALEWGVCPYTMSIFHGKEGVGLPDNPCIVANKSYFSIQDFRQVPSFATRPYVAGYPHMVSYIEIPLRSISGHIIGSYCVVDDKLRDFLEPTALKTIGDVTSAISSYLDLKRVEGGRIRSERMMNGLSQFVDTRQAPPTRGNATAKASGAQTNPFALNVFNQASELDRDLHVNANVEHDRPLDVCMVSTKPLSHVRLIVA